MRAIVIVLVVVNVLFFAMQMFSRETPTQQKGVATTYRQIGNLETLEEHNKKNKLSGLPLMEPRQKVAQTSSSASSEVGQPCELIGPFVELIHAENLVEQLTAHQIYAKVKAVEIVDGKKYWVYLKPEVSEKEALRRLYEVQAKQIDDAFIIPSGELANGISFGQFADEREAKTKADSVKSQGYQVEIKEMAKSHNETWVEVREKAGPKLSAEQWVVYMKEEKALERRQNYCFGVAN